MIDQPTVVIVGGGYGGVNAAKALDAYADVVLVEPKDVRAQRRVPARARRSRLCAADVPAL
jgi:NADH dehydrogenase FAD-containing subunit